jgi:trans-aconitate methyltransferase
MDIFSILADTASNFWKSHEKYPPYDNIKRRRFYEINYVLNKIHFEPIHVLVDLGCGDGGFVKCIDNLLEIDKIYCFDYSESLMSNIVDPKMIKEVLDCNNPSDYNKIPRCDMLMFGSVVNYIFDDALVVSLMSNFAAEHIFIRTPCTMDSTNDIVNVFSERLNNRYCSIYRTVESMIELINMSGLKLIEHVRIYPDDIESSFNTKQYMFYCKSERHNAQSQDAIAQ